MKKSFTICLIYILSSNIYAQDDITISKKFFSEENFRVGAILGTDLSWASNNGKTALISQNGAIPEENIFYSSSPNTSYFLGLDFYSPTSTLGFMTGFNINIQEYAIKNNSLSVTDSIKTNNIEIPIYVKLRMGSVLKGGQFWIALGGGYSFITKAEIQRTNSSSSSIDLFDAKNLFQANPFLSGILGYEFSLDSKSENFLNRDFFRILLYTKVNYDLSNRLDDANFNSNSTINSYSDPTLKFLRISLGLKILLRLSKAGEILKNTALKAK